MESTPVSGKSVRSNPGEYGFVYSADRPQPPPEAGWSNKHSDDHKFSLYSENIVKEGNTTESVDRESIANLTTTKKQWEVILTSHSGSHESSPIKKKVAPKWAVKIPYTDKHVVALNTTDHQNPETINNHKDIEETTMFKKPVSTESAIDREIRLAHEREDILRKEKEDRLKQTEKQKVQGQNIIASYEAESESFHQVYNELAEADRGPDLWSVEHGRRNEKLTEDNDDNNDDTYPNESIIEREIRLQREREAEIIKMRSHSTPNKQHLHQQQQNHSTTTGYDSKHENKDVNHNVSKTVSHKDSTAKKSHEGESLIAKELRELKEREEDIKRLHNLLHGSHVTNEVHQSVQSHKATETPANHQRPSQVETPSSHGNWNRDVSPFNSQQRRDSVESASSHGSGRTPSESIPSRRDVRVRPIADDYSDDEDKKKDYFEKQETPIEREMRLARERENELRRRKGLPELDNKDENPYGSYGLPESNNSTSVSKPRSIGQPSESMQKFATSRLQQEMLQQTEREHELRSQGKVISTSDHIEPKKYRQITGVDKVDGTEKRNFITKKTSAFSTEPDASLGQQEVASSGQTIRKTTTVAAGGNMFSYKEFKQNAESKIETELRELREREEELRLRRTNYHQEANQ